MAGVVLAAGASTRFASEVPKQLASWLGETLVHRATRVASNHLDPVQVVVGHKGRDVHDAVQDLKSERVRVVHNAHWDDGLGTSVRAAVATLDASSLSGVLFMPCDQPGIDELVLDAMLEAWRARDPEMRALVPKYRSSSGERRRGAPVVFDSGLFPKLGCLEGDQGGRQLLRELGDRVVELDLPDRAVGDDIDTVEDLRRLGAKFRGETV